MNIRRTIVFVPVAAMIGCLGGPVMAQDRGGMYASFGGSFVVPRDTELSGTFEDVTLIVDIATKSGFGAFAAAGYSLGSGLQAELELGYRGYNFDKFTKFTVRAKDASGSLDLNLPVDGDVTTISVMANGIYSFDLNRFRPYAGFGAGLAHHTAKLRSTSFEDNDDEYELGGEEDTATAFAYQAMAGIGYPLSDRAEVRLGYRYFATGDLDFGDGEKMTYGTHNFELGLQLRF